MFFWLSKILWFLVHPMNLFFISIFGIALFLAFRWYRAARFVSYGLLLACVLMATLPFGMVIQGLEDRFPGKPTLPDRIHGIIVLGGIINAQITDARSIPAMSGGVARISELKVLLEHSPNAKIVFTGGSGDPLNQQFKEAHAAPQVFKRFEIDPARVLFEDRSRNTYENAIFTYQMVRPQEQENWVLVTSAFHMPRSVGTFRQAGWQIIPYPVDYKTTGLEQFRLSFDFKGGVASFAAALHECLGLLFYWLTNRSDTLFPSTHN